MREPGKPKVSKNGEPNGEREPNVNHSSFYRVNRFSDMFQKRGYVGRRRFSRDFEDTDWADYWDDLPRSDEDFKIGSRWKF